MRQSLAQSADRDDLEPSATERPSCPSGHNGMNMQVTPQQNLSWAGEQCQNQENLSMDGRVVRLVGQLDLENLDALMTPISNDDETPGLGSAGTSRLLSDVVGVSNWTTARSAN